jgi:hypothetical protein
MNNTNHKILRVSSIIDNPSPVESLFNLEKYKLLAVGRSDNTIEIWNTDTWVQLIKINGTQSINIRKVFMVKKDRKVEGLFDNLRLFSIGTNGYLIEWSLFTGEPKVNANNKMNLDLLRKSRRMSLGLRFEQRQQTHSYRMR